MQIAAVSLHNVLPLNSVSSIVPGKLGFESHHDNLRIANFTTVPTSVPNTLTLSVLPGR
jgi:hypothetical protein